MLHTAMQLSRQSRTTSYSIYQQLRRNLATDHCAYLLPAPKVLVNQDLVRHRKRLYTATTTVHSDQGAKCDGKWASHLLALHSKVVRGVCKAAAQPT
jgi:hypothetical protein